MLNQIILIGKIKEIKEIEKKKRVVIEVDKPFNETNIKKSDEFVCELWSGIFDRILTMCGVGDLIAIKGRVNQIDASYIVLGENVVLLNKSKDNILKK